MIDALVGGKVHSAPVSRTGKTGKPFVTITLRVPVSDADAVFAHVIAFDDAVCRSLLALSAGDAVSVAGKLTPGAWTDKEGRAKPSVDVVADQVLSVYSIRKKRDASSEPPAVPQNSAPPVSQGQSGHGLRDLEIMHGPAKTGDGVCVMVQTLPDGRAVLVAGFALMRDALNALCVGDRVTCVGKLASVETGGAQVQALIVRSIRKHRSVMCDIAAIDCCS